jgi:hypothetical protein
VSRNGGEAGGAQAADSCGLAAADAGDVDVEDVQRVGHERRASQLAGGQGVLAQVRGIGTARARRRARRPASTSVHL